MRQGHHAACGFMSPAYRRDQQITVQTGDEGTGPPPHSHDWDESFYVTKGHVEFTCTSETVMCAAGTLVDVPAGTVHAFSYGLGGGEMLEITGRRRNAVSMFAALDREIPSGSARCRESDRGAGREWRQGARPNRGVGRRSSAR